MLRTGLIWIGGVALLGATAIDTLAVVGRHVGFPLTGSIELMQAAILVASAVGLVVATIHQTHAKVRLLVDRMGDRGRAVAEWVSDFLMLLFFIAMFAGSVWLAADLWDGHERSELLGVSWKALRLIANACLLACCLAIGWRLIRKPGR